MHHVYLLVITSALCQSPSAAVRLQDGSLVYLTLSADSIEIQTRYGKLTVPVGDVRTIEFGSHLVDEAGVKDAIRNLGSDTPKIRESATVYLRGAGPAAYHLILAASTSQDQEIRSRAAALLKHYQESWPAERLRASPDDTLTTADGFRATGRLLAPVRGKSTHLGDLTLRLPDVLSLRQSVGKDTVSVDAAVDGWTDTGIMIDARTVLAATGQVELWPQGPGQYVCGPTGHEGTMGKGGAFKAGALIGRIGNGQPFLIGERREIYGTTGILSLSVVPSPWNSVPSGGYTVRVTER